MHHIDVVSRLEADHLEQLPDLLRAAACADGHEPIGEHKFLRLQRGGDLAAAILAYENGVLAGYAHTLAYCDDDGGGRVSCEIVVHPEHRRRGVGRTLISHAILHAQAQDAHRLDLWAYNHSQASAALALQFGFRPVRRLLHLHRHVAGTPRAQALEGAALRAFRPGEDDRAWLALNNRIFAGHPENGRWTLDDLHARMAQPWFNPDDVLMLEVDGVLAGFCWVKVQERGDDGRVGEIYVIGTAPEYQGRGLGRYLLASALRHMRDRDAQVAAIYVDEANEAALRLYQAADFHHHHVDVCYSRELRAAVALPPDEAAA
jgi:mycothiol synthase